MSGTIEILADSGALAARVGALLVERLVAVQAEGGIPSIALTGGSIADELHRELRRVATDAPVDWSRVEIWWGDERFVAADSEDRNALQAGKAWLDHVPVDPDRVHPMPARGEGSLEEAAAAYGEDVRSHGTGRFDVVMLGLGPDGHVASLFPGYPALDVDDAVAVAVTDSPKPPPDRVSLTFGALNRATSVWFLVSGEGKADAVARAQAGEDLHDIPANGVRGEQDTVWFLDRDAASRLPD